MDKNLNSIKTFIKSFENLSKIKSAKKITATDLIRESGLSRQTFYRYFLDIDDFIYFIHNQNISLIFGLLDNLGYNNMIFKLYLKLMLEKQSFYKQIISFDNINHFTKMYFLKTRENMLKYLFLNHIDVIYHNENLEFSLNFYSFGYSYTILKWIIEKNPCSPEHLSSLLLENMPENLKQLMLD